MISASTIWIDCNRIIYETRLDFSLAYRDLLDIYGDERKITFKYLNMNTPIVSNKKPKLTSTQLYRLLDHPARRAILEVLRDGEHCVCHMEAYLGLRQAYISQQLAVLRDGGLVQDRRDGWNIFYRVSDPMIYQVLDTARLLTGEDVMAQINTDIVCTCPNCSSTENDSHELESDKSERKDTLKESK